MKHVNQQAYSQSIIQSVAFHSNAQVANNMLISNRCYGFQDKSLEKFSISPCEQYNVFAGNSGYLVLVSNRTKQ
ncbi:5904_t:CDS:2 [Gigaspora margarita]|uniref:5904_t:CDS:1 n=1 Tax=Gigaspora margarita TaxID=4874 RepID=A0ABN7V6S0_GIGMA|nr:5904_t:CDS:2 [Gigaspora margarita]